MEAFTAKDLVLVKFPFSDLSSAKLRPALVLASVGPEDIILAQITSQGYKDQNTVKIDDMDLNAGILHQTSYIRPSKVFTAHRDLIYSKLALLSQEKFDLTITKLLKILKHSCVQLH